LFEKKIAKLFNKKYGLMVNSCSSANLLALSSLSLKPGSEIITPSLTFSTTVSPIIQLGLKPVLVDIDLDSLLIDIKKVEKMISNKTKAMIIPNLIGNIPNLSFLKSLCKKYKLFYIEDSADTIDSHYNNKSTGYYSDISTTSFYASHVITCAGYGGMLCTNNKKFYKKAIVQRGWGRNSSLFGEKESIKLRFKNSNSYDEKYLFTELGYNFIPSEISAAFGIEQLKKLKMFSKLRNRNFYFLYKFFSKYSDYFLLPKIDQKVRNIWLAFPFMVKSDKINRNDLQIFLEKNNIQTRTIFTGNILKQPVMKNKIYKYFKGCNNVADNVMKNGILLGCHHGMSISDVNTICKIFLKFLNK
jgi:CDP-6-deoxy-D-xylo-4-hexulose-3-dehydrase